MPPPVYLVQRVDMEQVLPTNALVLALQESTGQELRMLVLALALRVLFHYQAQPHARHVLLENTQAKVHLHVYPLIAPLVSMPLQVPFQVPILLQIALAALQEQPHLKVAYQVAPALPVLPESILLLVQHARIVLRADMELEVLINAQDRASQELILPLDQQSALNVLQEHIQQVVYQAALIVQLVHIHH